MRSATNTIRLTTSWPDLDQALGGGLPLGRIVEIAGTDPEANRTMALRLATEAQRQDLVVTYVDSEQALDLGRARDLGVTVDDLLVSQPDTAEQALEIVETLVRTHVIGLVIVDSIAGFTMGVEEREDFSAVGSIRSMATALRKLASLGEHDTVIVFLGHTPVRKPLGPGAIHPPSSPASNGLRYYASVRMQVSRASSTANLATVKVPKNKASTNIFAEVTLRGFFDATAVARAEEMIENPNELRRAMLFEHRSRHKAIGYLPHADDPEGPIEFEATFHNGQWESTRSDEPMRLTTWAHLVEHPDVVLWDKRRPEPVVNLDMAIDAALACAADLSAARDLDVLTEDEVRQAAAKYMAEHEAGR